VQHHLGPDEPDQTEWVYSQRSMRYFHYWRDDLGVWNRIAVPFAAGSRPKLLMDRNDNAWLVFSGRHWLKNKSLRIAAATAAGRWTDWEVIYHDERQFTGEALVDPYRWLQEGVISVYIQQQPKQKGEPSALRIIDFRPALK
ncbi:MAG: hypothetical protein U9N45_07660, partial [Gemmatimonadota bacterium]|nr:hypothetical protein [Gemmatimonadota bacterium]